MASDSIIIFKPGPIGDFLHSLPVIHTLKARLPSSTITVVTGFELADLVEENPFIDNILYIPSNIFRGDPLGLRRLTRDLKRKKPHTFIDLKSNVKSYLIGFLSGASVRLHYRKQRMVREGRVRLHAMENLHETIYPLTGRVSIDDFRAYLREKDERFIPHFLESRYPSRTTKGGKEERIVAMNPNVSIPDSSRHWPPEYFARLGDRVKRELDAHVILIGGPEDREYCEEVAKMVETELFVTAGELTLGQTGAILSKCAVLITGDTGPMHLAAAVGTKVIALFGSMDPRRAGPYGDGHVVVRKDLPCAPCEEKVCPLGTTQCMKDISVDEVFGEVRNILRR